MKAASKKVRLVSLGCPKNLVDSEVMLGLLEREGWTPSVSREADVVIINTCSFIREAQEESIETILKAVVDKERGRCRLLVVAGCLPQRFGDDLAAELPEVDLFVGTGEFHRIARLLAKFERGTTGQRTFIGSPAYLYDHRTPRLCTSKPGSVYIKIAEGCSNFCSYCAIPKIRGKLRSRTIPSVLREARTAVARGAREINLIAQDITAYGKDRGRGTDLVRLLEGLAKLESLRWIRLLYTHPAHIPPPLIALIRDEPKICKYVDLPLQHIDDAVLRAMNRPFSGAQARELVARLREEVPGISIRTSLMVGFPGETATQFSRLLDFVREARFDHLGVFRYSREAGTPAATMKKQVPERLKAERFHRIMATQRNISRQKQRRLLGTTLSVLVERTGNPGRALGEGRWSGQAPEIDGKVFLSGEGPHPGEMAEARITRAGSYDLFGEILQPRR